MSKRKSQLELAIESLEQQKADAQAKHRAIENGLDAAIQVLQAQRRKAAPKARTAPTAMAPISSTT